MKIELNNIQSNILSPIQLQSLNLLAMNAVEITEYLKAAQLENPLLEYGPLIVSRPRYKYYYDKGQKNTGIYKEPRSNDYPDIIEFLISQFDLKISKRDFNILNILISNLSPLGYLELTANQAAKLAKCSVSQAKDAISYLQSLDPAGIAAYNLCECLKIQLRRSGVKNPVVYKMIDTNLNEISKNQYKSIAAAHNITIKKAIEYAEIIRSLNPKPARTFGKQESVFIAPDVIIFCDASLGTIFYELNPYSFPYCCINNCYKNLKYTKQDNKTKEYVINKLKQANFIITSVKNRIATFNRIIELIITFQRSFFLSGGDLNPLTLEKAADILNIHKSTMSRAIRDKYLECGYGTYPLKYFFEASVFKNKTPSAVKKIICNLIANEDKTNPLSDYNISSILADKGISVTRRTISNYRNALNIQSSNIRRLSKKTKRL